MRELDALFSEEDGRMRCPSTTMCVKVRAWLLRKFGSIALVDAARETTFALGYEDS